MKGHPTRKEIIAAALEPARRGPSFRDHLAMCPACAAIHDEAMRLLTPSDSGLPVPTPAALERIVSAHRDRKSAHGEPARRSLKEAFLKPLPVFSMAAVLAAAIIIPLFFFFIATTDGDMRPAFDMTLTRIVGGVEHTMPLSPADTVATSAGDPARIRLDDRLDITLDGGSHLVLEKALRERSGRRRRIAFILAGGSLKARLTAKAGIEAVFLTPHGHVSALGTEFRLAVSGGATTVLLWEGSLAAESSSGEKSVITGGTKCVISRGIKTAPMDAADNSLFTGRSVAPGPPRSAGTEKNSAAGPAGRVKENPSGGGAHEGGTVQKTSSRSTVLDELKQEKRDMKEMRRSMRRGAR